MSYFTTGKSRRYEKLMTQKPHTQPRKRCVICGKPVLSKSHRAKYCPACSVQERRRRDAERKRAQYWNLRI